MLKLISFCHIWSIIKNFLYSFETVNFSWNWTSDYENIQLLDKKKRTTIDSEWPLVHLIPGPEIKWSNRHFLFSIGFLDW
jgi:hypothetical protein